MAATEGEAMDPEATGWTKDIVAGLSFIGGIVTTLIITTWKASGFASRVESVEKEVDVLQKVVFKDTGGLHLMSEDRHTDVCRINQELFGKDLEPMLGAIARIEQRIGRIEEKLDSVWRMDKNARRGTTGQ
jgi:hypothetical protein